MATLVYFTDRYPFLEDWHTNDLHVLAGVFDRILVAPLEIGAENFRVSFPANVKVCPPLFTSGIPPFRRIQALRYLSARSDVHVSELLHTAASRSFSNLKKFAVSSTLGQRILSHEVFRSYVLPHLPGACLYFFWGRGYAEALPFLPAQFQARSLVRLHGYDLYEERNLGYVPYLRAIVKSAAILAPISEHGARHLSASFPAERHKIVCRRLGCVAKGKSQPSVDEVFRIVSCAYANPVKRLHLIPDSLQAVRRPIEWTHIGDGIEMPRIKGAISRLGQNVSVKLFGNVPAPEVSKIYAESPFDLFVSVSSSEGIPVSIMEALAAGIPVLATAVGGVPEIVDSTVGSLLPVDFSAEVFSERIEHFASLDSSTSAKLRTNCIFKHAQSFDAMKNAGMLAETLFGLAE